MATAFLDTNVVLRHLLHDHPDQSPRASAFLSCVERGEIEVQLADTVVFEAVFTLERHYNVARVDIRANLLPLLQMPGMLLPGKRKFDDVFALYVEENISFADAYHAVLMKHMHLTKVVSFDRHFDRISGISRQEP